MRIEQAQVKKGLLAGLAAALMVLALVAGAVLATGTAPTKRATSSTEVAKPSAVASSTAAPGTIEPRDADADRDIDPFELQLD